MQAGGVLIALAVVVAFGALILAARHQRAESRAVEETGRTVAQVERVQKLALDLETGLRGFVITGRASLESGAFALVTKPFDVPAFLRTVEAALAS